MTRLNVSQRYRLKYEQENDERNEQLKNQLLRQFRAALIRHGDAPEEIERQVEELSARLYGGGE